MIESLEKVGIKDVEIFTDTAKEPTTENVDRLVDKLLEKNTIDCILACGGGSVMDAAKAASVLAECTDKDLASYKAPYDMSGEVEKFPVIALPTTSGTGSEVTKFVVCTHSTTGEKMLCLGSAYVPRVALVDYELTLSVPAKLAAETGIDALCHSMEAMVSKKANWYSDACAKSALSAIGSHLRLACQGDRNGREAMSRAATMAGLAFGNASVTLIHGMSRPLGAHFHISHGLSNALLCPDITHFSLQAHRSGYSQVAQFLFPHDPTLEHLPTNLAQLNGQLGLPMLRQVLSHIKTQEFLDLIPRMAKEALASGSPANNPRLPSESDIAHLYRRIFLRGENNDAASWHSWQP
mmetsp:Transcript_14057/g.21213  ORF Transcript_14057/g.21213 Transcript_14057/m.21213 type:complete len:352 (-) Transcript_14057:268-1323(-)|eukprot:CAMPEP_0197293846 /NCGR_PEP_ID=MMETSP0890-20130614/30104_1 /TAXON_ID=44058 ORGANISM="Aureoumbra lagunensis, Strain CCMP1510" /NCGR_SAMPLE_ID=MMETSP0890 /ASSEMBLY_ACC=CAM_ASM_000533 /LENGTH=351 /DNA_ID=CAMNT_0042768891 /DNA_START=179 /DNA_END=1234 /DNA_ORIENTATION=+